MILFVEKVLRRLSKHFSFSLLYETSVGIKSSEQLISSDLFKYHADNVEFICKTENLYIGFDGLKDKYTNIDKSIIDSPHFEFIASINQNILEDLNYISQKMNGTIDFRSSVSNVEIQKLLEINELKKEAVLNNSYKPIQTVRINKKHYIADGKHTAALCHFFNISPRCTDVTSVAYDSFFFWVYKKMTLNPLKYSKHIEWFKKLYKIKQEIN